MSANKESLLIQFKKIIDENIEKGAKTSKDLRIGIPSKFIASDGKEYRLQNVGRYFRTGKNPTFLDVELNKEVTAARANALKLQTSPNVEKWNPKIDAVKGTEAHHKRMVKMYAPFYEGLNEKQAKELTQWFVDEGVPLGDAKSNLKNLSPKVHKEIHKWMQENNIQVKPDKTGKGNFVTIDKGPYKGTKFVKGSGDSAVKAVMPSFKELPINARFPLIANWLKYVQDPVDKKLSELEWDEYNRKHPIKPGNTAQISEIAQELAEENKLNKLIQNGSNGTNGVVKNGTSDLVNKLAIGKTKGKTLGRIGRWVAPSVLGGGMALLTGLDVKAREAKAKKTNKFLDKLQANIAKAELATDIAGAVPGPQSLITEPINFAAGGANLLIDGVRGYKSNGKTSTADRIKAVERLKFVK
tara:strand:+ start:43 stop:1281 length:1239 start_codon:yes stop_codon:yes gene_type:complete